jgi:hypothetical protein
MSNTPDAWLTEPAPEEGQYSVDVYAKDTDGDYVIPDSVTWSLYDLDGNVINSESGEAATPGNPTRITLAGDDLALTDPTADYEIRVLAIEVTVDSDVTTLQKRFIVKNLIGVT